MMKNLRLENKSKVILSQDKLRTNRQTKTTDWLNANWSKGLVELTSLKELKLQKTMQEKIADRRSQHILHRQTIIDILSRNTKWSKKNLRNKCRQVRKSTKTKHQQMNLSKRRYHLMDKRTINQKRKLRRSSLKEQISLWIMFCQSSISREKIK